MPNMTFVVTVLKKDYILECDDGSTEHEYLRVYDSSAQRVITEQTHKGCNPFIKFWAGGTAQVIDDALKARLMAIARERALTEVLYAELSGGPTDQLNRDE